MGRHVRPVIAAFLLLAVLSPVRSAAAAAHAGPLGVPAYSSFDPLDNGDPVQVRALSTRADLVSGGDVLIEVVVPAGTDLRKVAISAAGRDVTHTFKPGGPGLRGLVTGLPLGASTITAATPHGGARLQVRNAAQGGPVFSGPLIQPWTCTNGSKAKDCSLAPSVSYSYKPTGAGGLKAYNPASPPSDVATTTTDEGNTVPFIVRVETGYSLRDQYRIAALWDPAQGRWPDPTAKNPGFAHKLVLTHGASCDTAYASAAAPDVLLEDALSQGFAVASHALDNAGHNCNIVTQAESLIMTKEMVAERFGPIRYTIGSGCSGGSLVQQQVANAYPGVYQGITPQCSFPDAWGSAQQYVDYVGLRAYLEDPATFPEHKILPAQWPSI
ncbi:MAG: N-acetylmuramoyl-L-alanine amidase, partial [Frankiales bacterium]|nr:N-acetylmuramoyl-L-alanine amidase [Frankiales bacterium]